MDISEQKTVVAIGNFDGVHKGHEALLKAARALADEVGLPLLVLTFEPHPRAYFAPGGGPFRLTPESVKERRLRALGADRVDVLDFNDIMAGLSPSAFMDMIVAGHANAAHVVVGGDFRFGRGRAGDVAALKADGRFGVRAVPLEEWEGGGVVSSTRIREAIRQGDMAAANALLGWAWEIEGPVVHGDARGRTLGYPTANIPLTDVLVPAYGVYAAWVDIGDGLWRMGAASIGIRPTYLVKEPLLEVYILDFEGDLYDRTLRVRPHIRLRPEEKFDSVGALCAQIAADVAQVRGLLQGTNVKS